MAINYKEALGKMRNRRLGDDALSVLKTELYESRGKHDATRYALGAMQEVDPEYTRGSIEEGDRVKEHLNTALISVVEFRYQGSVPMNTHIRRGSDIDLLVIHGDFFSFDTSGAKSYGYGGYDAAAAMRNLRLKCEQSLTSRYHAAKVDTSGAKSIALSGGSFRRKIDVVPANWYDTKIYQLYGQEHLRDIQVFDKYTGERTNNSPFLFKQMIDLKDSQTQGGVKKVVRMLKNIKNDCTLDVALTNYDITSLVWHMHNDKRNMPPFLELALLANAQEFLDYLYNNPVVAKELYTPDHSRKIMDKEEKLEGLKRLSYEVDKLAEAVYKELYPLQDQVLFSKIRQSFLNERV